MTGFMNYTLIRSPACMDGLFGLFSDNNNKPLCLTVENVLLRIPEGNWHFTRYMSPTKGQVWMAVDIPGRADVELHNANLAAQLCGCIAVGQAFIPINGIIGVSNSVDTLNMLRLLLPCDFTLTIKQG